MHDIYQLLLATFAVMGQEMPDLAIKTMAEDLKGYDSEALSTAFQRCRRELKRMTLSDVIERIPGEHPGPEEAWATMAQTLAQDGERHSVVATQPMLTAFGIARKIPGGDRVAQRLAFKEVYQKEVSTYRISGLRPMFVASLGWGNDQREKVEQEVAAKNLLAQKTMPHLAAPNFIAPPQKGYPLG